MCVLVALGDAETAIDPKNIKKVNRGQMLVCNQAGMMINNEVFQKWIAAELSPEWTGVIDRELADRLLKRHCGIESKTELDKSDDARSLWEGLFDQFAIEHGWRAEEQ